MYSCAKRERCPSPLPLSKANAIRKPLQGKDLNRMVNESIKAVVGKTGDINKAHLTAENDDILRTSSTDQPAHTLTELTDQRQSGSLGNDEDEDLSLFRPHMSNADSDVVQSSTSESLTVTFILTTASESSSSSTNNLPPIEKSRKLALNLSDVPMCGFDDLPVDIILHRDRMSSSEDLDLMQNSSDNEIDLIRNSTPVHNSDFSVNLFDSLSTISELEHQQQNIANLDDDLLEGAAKDDVEDADDDDQSEEEDEEEEEEEEEELFSFASLNEKTPPRPKNPTDCISVPFKHCSKTKCERSNRKLKSSRCIFPEENDELKHHSKFSAEEIVELHLDEADDVGTQIQANRNSRSNPFARDLGSKKRAINEEGDLGLMKRSRLQDYPFQNSASMIVYSGQLNELQVKQGELEMDLNFPHSPEQEFTNIGPSGEQETSCPADYCMNKCEELGNCPTAEFPEPC